jgi:hypothetical protein
VRSGSLFDGGSEAGERQRIQGGEVSNCVISPWQCCTLPFERVEYFSDAPAL